MKYLDTFESWGQIFKICRAEDGYILWIHKHDKAYKFQLDHNELQNLIDFMQDFIKEDGYCDEKRID
jgi:hypothetical protein